MRRVVIAVVSAILLTQLLSVGVASGARPERGCGKGFDIGLQTVDQAKGLPRIQDALANDIYSEEEFAGQFENIDRNGNGLLCLKDVGKNNGSADGWAYFYNAVDDNAAA